jgi:hypothetical protein
MNIPIKTNYISGVGDSVVDLHTTLYKSDSLQLDK